MSYRLDGSLLADRYRALQQALHPDRHAAAGEVEKRLSMQASTRVNDAFQTLKDPLERARYMLVLYTGDVGDDKETTQDMAFLTEQMELREALAEVKGQPDPTAAVAVVLDRLSMRSGALLDQLDAVLGAPSEKNLEAARELVRKLQFVAKCRAEAENLEAELDELV